MSKKSVVPPKVTIRLVVVDTSYLLELFRVPRCSETDAFDSVFQRFEKADGVRVQLYVPLPVLFELGNHIADVKDGGARHRLAGQLVESVQMWLSGEMPYTVVSSMDDSRTVEDFCAALAGLTAQFAALAPDSHGLTNTSVVMEAQRLRDMHKNSGLKHYLIHIWTRDHRLKALEPDAETDAFV